MRALTAWGLASLVWIVHAGQPASARPVSVCADPDPPPWTYWVRDSHNKKTNVFIGSSVETVRAAFERIGHTVEFKGEYPWARCLVMVARGDVDFAMDAYFDRERAKHFAYSTHYNTLTPQVFFRKQKPVVLKSLSDLKKFRGCGMSGSSYSHYGLTPDELDLGSSYDRMITKLKRERCDYFVEELEVISGYKIIGTDYLADPDIQHGPVPGAHAPAKHLITAKDGEAVHMLPALNTALTDLVKSGETEKAWKKHTGNSLPFHP
jgi:polar amino acid transport system substrate-binding protein